MITHLPHGSSTRVTYETVQRVRGRALVQPGLLQLADDTVVGRHHPLK